MSDLGFVAEEVEVNICHLKAVMPSKDEKIPEEEFPEIIGFCSFHDAWQWIYDNHGKYLKLTNPTMNVEINEIPTEERAERLYRYAKNILENIN